MTFASTYAEYRHLRIRLGYDPDLAIAQLVWENCSPEDQECMLNQFRRSVEIIDHYSVIHGEVW